MPVHPGAAAPEQDRTGDPVANGPIEGAADRRRQRDQDRLAAFAGDPQDPAAVFISQIADVQAGGFEDPQPE